MWCSSKHNQVCRNFIVSSRGFGIGKKDLGSSYRTNNWARVLKKTSRSPSLPYYYTWSGSGKYDRTMQNMRMTKIYRDHKKKSISWIPAKIWSKQGLYNPYLRYTTWSWTLNVQIMSVLPLSNAPRYEQEFHKQKRHSKGDIYNIKLRMNRTRIGNSLAWSEAESSFAKVRICLLVVYQKESLFRGFKLDAWNEARMLNMHFPVWHHAASRVTECPVGALVRGRPFGFLTRGLCWSTWIRG